MKYITAIFAFLAITTASCKKDDTGLKLSLPAATQSGQNIFGFMLNSDVWTNYGQVCFPFAGGCRENLSGYYSPDDGYLSIAADKVLSKNGSWDTQEHLDINLNTNFHGTGTYNTFSLDTLSIYYSFSKIHDTADLIYILPELNPTFNITVTKIDLIGKILSGEFSGILFKRTNLQTFETSATDSININKGRFDIRLK